MIFELSEDTRETTQTKMGFLWALRPFRDEGPFPSGCSEIDVPPVVWSINRTKVGRPVS